MNAEEAHTVYGWEDVTSFRRSVDKEKIVQTDIKTIYSSPLRRAKETAEIIAEVNKANVIEVPELIDLHFSPISKEIYKQGKVGILTELFGQGENATVNMQKIVTEDNSLLVSHGLIIVKLFMQLFRGKPINDKYTKYLSGFCIDNNDYFTLSK